MHPLVPVLLAAALLSGCAAKGEDLFAYARKPLYAATFDLSEEKAQAFRVEDGSIGALRVLVWVNATAGGGRVVVTDPSGDRVLDTTASTQVVVPLDLGIWTVEVTPGAGATGRVSILVVRS